MNSQGFKLLATGEEHSPDEALETLSHLPVGWLLLLHHKPVGIATSGKTIVPRDDHNRGTLRSITNSVGTAWKLYAFKAGCYKTLRRHLIDNFA